MAGLKLNILISDQIMQDLNKKLLIAPALAPYIVSRMAGMANIKLAVPGILSGKLEGFKPRTGRTRRAGLKAIFKNTKTGFQASLWTPLFNLFTGGTKRGIKPVALIQTLSSQFESSSIPEDIIKQALDDFDNNKLGNLNDFISLGTRRRSRRSAR